MFRLLRPDRKTLTNSLIEAVLIVFSVLVALAGNHWRTEHVARQRLARHELQIRIELENNQAILREVIPYHEQEVARIRNFLAQPDLSEKIKGRSLRDLQLQLMPRGFWRTSVTPGLLSDAAWQSAIADNSVALMNVALLNKLTQYYSYQNATVVHYLQDLNRQFLIPQMFDPKSTVIMLRLAQGWFSIMAGAETSTLDGANAVLRALPPAEKLSSH